MGRTNINKKAQENDALSAQEMNLIGQMFTNHGSVHKKRLVMVPRCRDGDIFPAFIKGSCLHVDDFIVGFEGSALHAKTMRSMTTHHIKKDFLQMDIAEGSYALAFLHFSLGMDLKIVRDYVAATTRALDEDVGLAVIAMPAKYYTGDIVKLLAKNYERYYLYRSGMAGSCMVVFTGSRNSETAAFNASSFAAAVYNAPLLKKGAMSSAKKYPVYKTKEIDTVIMRPKSFDMLDASSAILRYQDDWVKVKALGPSAANAKNPVMPLRSGHIAQLLASGVMNGVLVEPDTQERFLVKGAVNRIEEPIIEDEGDVFLVTKACGERAKKERTLFRDIVTIMLMRQNGVIEQLQ